MKRLLALAATAALLAAAGHAAATEYVTNGGFETDDISGWTQVGDWTTGYNYVSTDGHDSQFELHAGNFAGSGAAGVSQTLATSSGANYDITLWFRNSGGNTADGQLLQVLWNNAVVGQISGASFSGDYTQLDYHVVGAGADTLTIQGYSSSGYNFIDDISVVQGAAVVSGPGENGGVPEPASWALMLTGFFGLGSVLRRRAALAA
jgi:hypothetical protein